MITAIELAELEECSVRWIRKKANNGDYVYQMGHNDLNKQVFLFPVEELPLELQVKYEQKQMEKQKYVVNGVTITHEEQEEIKFWTEVLKAWRWERNNSPLSAEEVDEGFVAALKINYPKITISRRILYRKYEIFLSGKYINLIDHRGKHNKGRTIVTEEMRNAYLYYYMDEAQPAQIKCYEYMKMVIADKYPEQYSRIPSAKTMHRDLIEHLPDNIKTLARSGKKSYDDICGYHIRRTYEDLESNEWWVGDTHTIDVMSMDEDGKQHRLYLNAWMDVRSGIFVGWHITDKPSSQATVYALRDAILRRDCLPKNVYVDNGREYLTYDVGGLGHRQKKSTRNDFQPPPILSRLDINMVNALVKNAKAKIIERRFLDFKNAVSKLFHTYTGGSIFEKPEILKVRLKNGQIVIDDDLKAKVNEIIEHYFNYQVYGGKVFDDRGKSRIEIYYENMKRVRSTTKDSLNLMLMRSSKPKKVGRRGLSHKINGELLDYWSYELHMLWGKEVYYRYDPDDLSIIRVYDLEDRYLMDVPCANDTVLRYGATQEEIKHAQRIVRETAKRDAEAVAAIRAMNYPSPLELVLAQAKKNKENPVPKAKPNQVVMHITDEEYKKQITKVQEPDLDLMIKNIKLRKEM